MKLKNAPDTQTLLTVPLSKLTTCYYSKRVVPLVIVFHNIAAVLFFVDVLKPNDQVYFCVIVQKTSLE